MEVSNEILKQFGVSCLRSTQEKIIDHILYSDKNILAIIPTGGGKTLCFQYASCMFEGVTVILYPLLSLMNDQYNRFKTSGVNTVILKGGQTKEQRKEIFNDIKNGKVKVIITNPETLTQKTVINNLLKLKILLVIDEAHTVVEWGETFRSSFLEMSKVINTLDIKKIACFSATVTKTVESKLKKYIFKNSDFDTIRFSANRENITYTPLWTFSRGYTLKKILRYAEYPVLIFTPRRKDAKRCAEFITNNITNKVKYYHAGLTREKRKEIEDWFYKSSDGILCSTCAFGMGVDKNNIRTVIHLSPSSDISSFLQETGRAGRDNKSAKSYIILKNQDRKNEVAKIFFNPQTCYRRALLFALGEDLKNCKGECSLCKENLTRPLFRPYEKEILKLIRFESGYYKKEEFVKLLTTRDFLDLKLINYNADYNHKEIKEVFRTLMFENKITTINRVVYSRPLNKISNFKQKFFNLIFKIYSKINKDHLFS